MACTTSPVNGVRVDVRAGDEYRRGHRFGNQMLTSTVRFLFGDRIEDMLSGYKVLSRRFVKSFPVLSSGFEIETEMAVHALELGMPIAHVKCTYRSRPEGSISKLNTLADGRRILFAIINLFKQERPLLFLGFVAALFAAMSLAIGIPVTIEYPQTGVVLEFPRAFLALGLMVISFLTLACGVILDTVSRGRLEAKLLRYLSIPPIINAAAELDALCQILPLLTLRNPSVAVPRNLSFVVREQLSSARLLQATLAMRPAQ